MTRLQFTYVITSKDYDLEQEIPSSAKAAFIFFDINSSSKTVSKNSTIISKLSPQANNQQESADDSPETQNRKHFSVELIPCVNCSGKYPWLPSPELQRRISPYHAPLNPDFDSFLCITSQSYLYHPTASLCSHPIQQSWGSRYFPRIIESKASFLARKEDSLTRHPGIQRVTH